MSCRCVSGCVGCRENLPADHALHRHKDIVQIQKEVGERMAQEEREGKRRPPIIRWGGE